MDLARQMDRIVELKVHHLAGLSEAALRDLAAVLPDVDQGIIAIHPSLVPASRLAHLLSRAGKPGFVVVDMTDLDDFIPRPEINIPERPLYLIQQLERGDEMSNWSPDEALPEIHTRGRSPLTVNEGISWLLQDPEQLQPNYCFMCLASRKPKGTRLDAQTPAIWISGGTGRDGRENRDAPKVGWCWAGNRHTWLGFASTAERLPN
jgi:hypothetical protein